MDSMSLKDPEPVTTGTPKRFADMAILSASTLELPGKTPDDEADGNQMLSVNFNTDHDEILGVYQDMVLFVLGRNFCNDHGNI